MTSVSRCYTDTYFCTISYSLTQKRLLVLEKGYLNYRKHLSIGKNNCSKTFCKLPTKTPRVESFLTVQISFSGENLLATNSVKRNPTAEVISGIFKDFKNMHDKRL